MFTFSYCRILKIFAHTFKMCNLMSLPTSLIFQGQRSLKHMKHIPQTLTSEISWSLIIYNGLHHRTIETFKNVYLLSTSLYLIPEQIYFTVDMPFFQCLYS